MLYDCVGGGAVRILTIVRMEVSFETSLEQIRDNRAKTNKQKNNNETMFET